MTALLLPSLALLLFTWINLVPSQAKAGKIEQRLLCGSEELTAYSTGADLILTANGSISLPSAVAQQLVDGKFAQLNGKTFEGSLYGDSVTVEFKAARKMIDKKSKKVLNIEVKDKFKLEDCFPYTST